MPTLFAPFKSLKSSSQANIYFDLAAQFSSGVSYAEMMLSMLPGDLRGQWRIGHIAFLTLHKHWVWKKSWIFCKHFKLIEIKFLYKS